MMAIISAMKRGDERIENIEGNKLSTFDRSCDGINN